MNRTVIVTLIVSLVLAVAMCFVIFLGDFDEDQIFIVSMVITAIVLVCVAIMLIVLLRTRKTKVVLGDKGFEVHGLMVDISILYSDIKSMETRDEMIIGIRAFGADFGRYVGGTFKNKEFGVYKISLQCNIKKMIVIRHLEGTLVFNQDSMETTIMTYESIKKRAKNLESS
jgi:hypothetical protein